MKPLLLALLAGAVLAAPASAASVDVMVVGKRDVLVPAHKVTLKARSATVDGRRCALGKATPVEFDPAWLSGFPADTPSRRAIDAMFAEHGLNVAPQPDNGANPRPDNRSGWLEGETPDVVAEHVAAAAPALDVTLWDPSSQLRYRKKSSVPPRPDGAPNRGLRSAA